jgi:putative DNA methylase
MIDRWFPVSAVDEACGTTAGSGLVEKAVFTWFASRPIAQARAGTITALLPPSDEIKTTVDAAVRYDDRAATDKVSAEVLSAFAGRPPVVLDMFSGRGILPLEAARVGAKATGVDLSPVAVLAGRLLADYPARDWSNEVALPYGEANSLDGLEPRSERLVRDVAATLSEVGKRLNTATKALYPKSPDGTFPWAYLWAITIPCDECSRRFPLLGSLVLRHPYSKNNDPGQSLRITTLGDTWSVDIIHRQPSQQPTYCAGTKDSGKKKKGKTARCIFCGFVHSLEAVKAKGFAGEYQDRFLAVCDMTPSGKRSFRLPNEAEVLAVEEAESRVPQASGPYSAVPDENIPPMNGHTIMASGYGYKTFGSLMCKRQSLLFATTVETVRGVLADLRRDGISEEYVGAIGSYVAATVCRRLRYSTRGARLRTRGDSTGDTRNTLEVDHVFSNESKITFQFDSLEVGLGGSGGTWQSVSESSVKALKKVLNEQRGPSARFIRGSSTALPLRDNSVDVVITDPPYYDMIEYADASDLFYVWLKRLLFDIHPDLFSVQVQEPDGLQNKNDEIIVRRVHEPNRVKHDTEFYEDMLAKSFSEARRVLKTEGHLVVMFGHSDPDAWRRLLGALQTAGFVVTSAWPSRTEGANTGVASIKVTVTIGCRVAATHRPVGIGSEVDREVVDAVSERVTQWDADGLALEDQLMASYGPAMEVYGRYSRVLNPDGSDADLDHYLGLARRAVRDAMRLRVDELPIETFDAVTRFAIFWLRAKGRADVPKGEARFFAQADELRLDDLRGRVLAESKAGFKIELRDEKPVTAGSSVFEVVRAMAHAWDTGGMEAVADVLLAGGVDPTNHHLWAVVGDLASRLPASDKTAKALAGIKRSSATISTLAASSRSAANRPTLFDTTGTED